MWPPDLAEIRVFTRIGGVALGQILLRELAGKLTVVAHANHERLACSSRAPTRLVSSRGESLRS